MKGYKRDMLQTSILVTIAFTLSTAPAFADSSKVFFTGNSHYYQRFDIANTNWSKAKSNCETLKGHLATFPKISGENIESTFVYNALVSKSPAGSNADYFIGAYYIASIFEWAWITGEDFNNILTVPNAGYDYLAINSGDGLWYSIPSEYNGYSSFTDNAGYICEWDGNHMVSNATVPDINGNGTDEIATLYLDYANNKHTVVIRDPKSHSKINTLTFATSNASPIGLAVINDINNNNIPEIAVLSGLKVQIKDAKDNSKVLKSIDFLDKTYLPRAISIMPDSNKNSFDELTVLGILKSGKATSETRDSSTGIKLFSDTF